MRSLSIVSVFLLAACGKGESTKEGPTSDPAKSDSAKPVEDPNPAFEKMLNLIGDNVLLAASGKPIPDKTRFVCDDQVKAKEHELFAASLLKAGPLKVTYVSAKLNLANYIGKKTSQNGLFWIVAVTGPGVPVRAVTFSKLESYATANEDLDAKVPEVIAFGRGFQAMAMKPNCGGFHSVKAAELASQLKIPVTDFYGDPIGTDTKCKEASEYFANHDETRKMGTADPIEISVGLTDGTEHVVVPVKIQSSGFPGRPACMDIEKAYALTK